MRIMDASVENGFYVWLDGVNVSHLTIYAVVSDQPYIEGLGTLTMLVSDPTEKPVVDPETGDLITVERSGMVRWEPMPDANSLGAEPECTMWSVA